MWTRGQYCCLVTGQVAGTAAALAAQQGVTPEALEIGTLQRVLSESGIDIGSAAAALTAAA
jgi:hypothetical protein